MKKRNESSSKEQTGPKNREKKSFSFHVGSHINTPHFMLCVSVFGQMAPNSGVFEGYKTTLFRISQAVCFKSNSWSLWVESQ